MLNSRINPMLARTSPPFHSNDYLYEVKWDGERIIAFAENGAIKKLQSRKGMDVSRKFPEIIGAPIAAKNTILDGEIIWIEPMKIEVRYFEIEETGSFRYPIFWKIVSP